jgi:hypothetical protein
MVESETSQLLRFNKRNPSISIRGGGNLFRAPRIVLDHPQIRRSGGMLHSYLSRRTGDLGRGFQQGAERPRAEDPALVRRRSLLGHLVVNAMPEASLAANGGWRERSCTVLSMGMCGIDNRDSSSGMVQGRT